MYAAHNQTPCYPPDVEVERFRNTLVTESRLEFITPKCAAHRLTVLTFPVRQSLRELGAHGLLGPILKISDSECLRWGPRICISNKFTGSVNAVGLGTPLGEPLHRWPCYDLL